MQVRAIRLIVVGVILASGSGPALHAQNADPAVTRSDTSEGAAKPDSQPSPQLGSIGSSF